MTMNNPLAAVLSHILNCERVGKSEATVRPASNMIKGVLDILQDEQMIGEAELIEDGRGDMLKVNLLGHINKCGVITPRFAVRKDNFEKYEKKYLPSRDFGVIIVLTSQGMMTHRKAKEKGIGGRLLAYCY
ncbi:MAG: 30S ribosomal protein S8 [Nanoarchaeota archaeon]